jgi:hypothetical protein
VGILRDWPGLENRTLALRGVGRHKRRAMSSDPNDKRLVDHFGLAAVLDVSPEKVKALHRAGVLPAYQTGPKQLRFDVEECLARLRVDAPSTAKAAS